MEKKESFYFQNIKLDKHPQFGTRYKNYFTVMLNESVFPAFKNNSFISLSLNMINSQNAFNIFINPDENPSGKEGTIKIQINLNNVKEVEIEENSTNKTTKNFFFSFLSPPKVFISTDFADKDKSADFLNKPTYFQKFKAFQSKFSFINHYHFDYFQKITHPKAQSDSIQEENSFHHEFAEKLTAEVDEMQYVRVDSFFSKNTEFLNFYLLNLVMKIKITFDSQNDYFRFISKANLISKIKVPNEIKTIRNEGVLKEIKEKLKNSEGTYYHKMNKLHFNLQYSYLSYITETKQNIFNINTDLLSFFSGLSCEDQEIAAAFLTEKIKEILRSNCVTSVKTFENIREQFSAFKASFEESLEKIEEELSSYVKTIDITPSVIYYRVPKREKLSLLLRKNEKYFENFVKVNFTEEDLHKMYLSNYQSKKFLVFLRKLMATGFYVGTRHFSFLSSSNSQIKNISFWFFNIEGTTFNSLDEMIEEIGDFSKEKNALKNASRRGLLLTTTTPVVVLQKEQIRRIPDIERNGYIFSDGIGQISKSLVNKCNEKLGKNSISSSFQFRLGVCKGMLSLNPDLDGDVICVRPSMIKSDSDDLTLGIVKAANYSPGYLNRQIIILLNSLGVPSDYFIHSLQSIIKNYQELSQSPENALKLNDTLQNELFSKISYFSTLVRYYLESEKISLMKEPLVSQVIMNFLSVSMINLRKKGKMYEEEACTLMGVLDEYEILEEDEVYVRIVQNETSFTISGEVIVTKNPCLHPGDIKILRAKGECPSLSHLINVVVFSSKGDRPMPNQISGGDLDGDYYFVSWNKALIAQITKRNVEPPLDPKNDPIENHSDDKVGIIDTIDGYLQGIQNNNISRICNLHCAFADGDKDNGAFNDKCLLLNKLFLIEVDSMKTGRFIGEKVFHENGLELKAYPDFLEIEGFKAYESKGILGVLYRYCKKNDFVDKYKELNRKFSVLQEYELDFSLVTQNSVFYSLDALKIYAQYQKEILSLMKEYNCQFEPELFVEKIDKKNKEQSFKETMCIVIKKLISKYSEMIRKTFGNELNKDVASAVFLVTYLNEKSLNRNIIRERFSKEQFLKLYELMKALASNNILYSSKSDSLVPRIFSLPWIIPEIRRKLI